jgi:16S rRNA (uracil1498-N3)-methyltransferase
VNPALRGSAAHVFVNSVDAPELDADDEHHLRRVLRVGPTDVVTVSDGRGSWIEARLGRDQLTVASAVNHEPPPPVATVLSAVPKGDRLEWMVQKLTELGATRIGFLDCARSVVRWDAERAARHLPRLRRVAREAAMQSRRTWLPEVGQLVSFDGVAGLESAALADPDGATRVPVQIDTILVGPEGGFTPDELSMNGRRVALGPHVLRIETAAIAAAVMLTLRNESD